MKLRVKFLLTSVDKLGESGNFTCQTEEDGKSFCCARVNDYRKERTNNAMIRLDSMHFSPNRRQQEGVGKGNGQEQQGCNRGACSRVAI